MMKFYKLRYCLSFFAILLSNILVNGQSAQNLSGVVNRYTPVLSMISTCQIVVEDASQFKADDQILLIQMKGAELEVPNNSSFGDIKAMNEAGKHLLNYIARISNDTVTLVFEITPINFDFTQAVQMVSVPTYNVINVNGRISPRSWDGRSGGIVILEALDSLILSQDISADSAGYRGGVRSVANYNCNEVDYFYPLTRADMSGFKGESFARITNQHITGRGSWATGGGGGNNHNSGGGGGSNWSTGGLGGKQSYVNSLVQGCNDTTFVNGGLGGKPFNYSNSGNNVRMFFGGGGGGGHQNDTEPNGGGVAGMGGSGGGIVILISPKIRSANRRVSANGGDVDSLCGRDGAGGGGGGGTIFLYTDQVVGNLTLEAKGGRGGDNNSYNTFQFNLGASHGTGGGGGGGYAAFKTSSVPSGVTNVLTGGRAGLIVNTNSFNYPGTYGAQPGGSGTFQTNVPVVRPTSVCESINIDAKNDFLSLGKDTRITFSPLVNDDYNRGVSISICNTSSGPKRGTISINGDSMTYEPNPGFAGRDTIRYCLCTKIKPETCDSALIFIEVTEVKVVAVRDVVNTFINVPVNAFILNNDSINISAITSITVPPLYGTLTPINNFYRYQPAPNFSGIDSFEYEVCSVGSPVICSRAWAVVNVIVGVVAADDAARTATNVSVKIRPKLNDLINLPVILNIVKQPKNGTAQIQNQDSINYLPQAGFSGFDTIVYSLNSISPSGIADTAIIVIEVTPLVRANDDVATAPTGRAKNLNPLPNDVFPPSGVNVSLLTPPINGTATVSPDRQNISYTSQPSYTGADALTYVICSKLFPDVCDTAVINITVAPPTTALDDNAITAEDIPVDIRVTVNDIVNEAPIRYTIDSAGVGPRNGRIEITDTNFVKYIPNPNFFGLDSFKYKLCTRTLPIFCSEAWVRVNVTPVNDPPVVPFIIDSTSKNRSKILDLINLISDPDGDNLTTTIFKNPANGILSVMDDYTLRYRPNTGFVGVDSMRYQVCDDGVPFLCVDNAIVIYIRERTSLEIPNGISPNGDRKNDVWVIDGIESIPENEIFILNRWGNVVWTGKNYQNNWGGVNTNGDPLPDGTYFYIIKLPVEGEDIKGYIVIQSN
jgi:gliding motility-associated-like protein